MDATSKDMVQIMTFIVTQKTVVSHLYHDTRKLKTHYVSLLKSNSDYNNILHNTFTPVTSLFARITLVLSTITYPSNEIEFLSL